MTASSRSATATRTLCALSHTRGLSLGSMTLSTGCVRGFCTRLASPSTTAARTAGAVASKASCSAAEVDGQRYSLRLMYLGQRAAATAWRRLCDHRVLH